MAYTPMITMNSKNLFVNVSFEVRIGVCVCALCVLCVCFVCALCVLCVCFCVCFVCALCVCVLVFVFNFVCFGLYKYGSIRGFAT